MARFLIVVACVLAAVALVAGQGFDFFGGYQGLFDAPSARDPRQNRGPVTFPVTSTGSETSGVRVGASGYGFVPPGARNAGFGRQQGAGPNYFSGVRYW